MSEQFTPKEDFAQLFTEQPELALLLRVLQRAQGFALYFAHCNVPAYRTKLTEALRAHLSRPIAVVDTSALAEMDQKTRPSIDGYVETQLEGVSEDAVVFIIGLENLLPSRDKDRVWATTQELNWRRGFFQRMRRPMVFWLPEYALTLMARNAPDLYDWYSGVYDLELPQQMRSEASRATLKTIEQTEEKRWLSKDERDRWEDVLLELLSAVESHARTGSSPKLEETATEQSDLLNQLGRLYRDRAEYKMAKDYLTRALAVDEAAFGPNHPRVATDINNLAVLLQDLGELSEARQLSERALKNSERAFGSNHPNVAGANNNLAIVLQDMGELSEARRLFERALRIDEAAFGPDHPRIAINLNNLASVLRDMGELDEARRFAERALRIDEVAFGSDHPRVAVDLNNLATVFRDLRELDSARRLHERALKIDEAAFGVSHPSVATDLNNLASVLKDSGELTEAQRLIERSLIIFRKFLGDDHPNTEMVKANLNTVLKELGETSGE